MASVEIERTEGQLEEAFAIFERDYPEVAQAMKVMNISFLDYLQALAALKEVSSTSSNDAVTS